MKTWATARAKEKLKKKTHKISTHRGIFLRGGRRVEPPGQRANLNGGAI
jgi:hypothetical protein